MTGNEVCFPPGQPGISFTVSQFYVDQETKQECAHVHLSCQNCVASFCARQIPPGPEGFSLSLPPASDSQGTFSSLQQQRHISVSKGAQPESLERELSQCGHGMLHWAPVTSESLAWLCDVQEGSLALETGQDGSGCPSLLNTTAHHETSSKLSDLSDPWFSFLPYQAAGSGTGEDG